MSNSQRIEDLIQTPGLGLARVMLDNIHTFGRASAKIVQMDDQVDLVEKLEHLQRTYSFSTIHNMASNGSIAKLGVFSVSASMLANASGISNAESTVHINGIPTMQVIANISQSGAVFDYFSYVTILASNNQLPNHERDQARATTLLDAYHNNAGATSLMQIHTVMESSKDNQGYCIVGGIISKK